MPTLTVEIWNDPDGPLRGEAAFEVRLGFSPSRTKFTGATLAPDHGPIEILAPTPLLVWVTWEKPLMPADRIEIQLEFRGERPLHQTSRLGTRMLPDSRQGVELFNMREDALAVARELALDLQRTQVQEETQSLVARALEERQLYIDGITDDPLRQKQEQFFFDLDKGTNGVLMPEGSLRSQIKAATDQLARCLVDRVDGKKVTGTSFLPRAMVEELSTLQLPFYTAHFGAGGAFRISECDAAFVAFASGQLRPIGTNPNWNARPDSANFFMFAEFAIHAIHHDVARAMWLSLLPTFVKCQQLYVEVYAPYCDTPRVQKVPVAHRNFEMYFVLPPLDDVNVSELIARVEATLEAAQPDTLERLVALHTSNAIAAFPKGDRGSPRTCEALRNITPPPSEPSMTTPSFPDLMVALARDLRSYVGQDSAREDAEKYACLDPLNPGHLGSVSDNLTAAEAASQGRPVFGPLVVLWDSANANFWDRTPVRTISLSNGNLRLEGTRDDQPATWNYPSKQYTTYVLVVKKPVA